MRKHGSQNKDICFRNRSEESYLLQREDTDIVK